MPVPQRNLRTLVLEPGHTKKGLPGKLMKLAQSADVAGLRAALDANPSIIHGTGSFGRTLLWEACRKGRQEAVELLVERGADLYANGSYNNETTLRISPYCAAVSYKRKAIAAFLRERGAAENLDVYRSAFLGEAERVVKLLDLQPSLLLTEDAEDDIYFAPLLSYAIVGGHYELAETLIQRGADVATYSEQLLLFAARAGRRDLVDLLLNSGADVTTVPAGIFVAAADLGLLRYLLEKGAPATGHNFSGFPPIVYVARGDKGEHPEKIALLLEFGADVNERTRGGRTALEYAREARHEKVIALLMRHGAI